MAVDNGADQAVADHATAVAFSPGGAYLLAGTMAGSIHLFRCKDGALVKRCHCHSGAVLDALWLTADVFCSGGTDGAVSVRKVLPAADGVDLQHMRQVSGHSGHINAVAVSPDGRLLCTASDDKTACLWELAPVRPSLHLLQHACRFCAARRLVLLRAAARVQADGTEDRAKHTLAAGLAAEGCGSAAKPAPVLACAFRPAGPSSANPELPLLVATCCGASSPSTARGAAAVWCCTTGELQHVFEAGTRQVAAVAWSPCGRFLAAAAMDKVARVWEVAQGRQVAAVDVDDITRSVAWSTAGRLCFGLGNGAAHVLDLDTEAL